MGDGDGVGDGVGLHSTYSNRRFLLSYSYSTVYSISALRGSQHKEQHDDVICRL